MKTMEAIIPDQRVGATIKQLREIEVNDITVEPVKVFKKDVYHAMIYRGCAYQQDFTFESRIRFLVPDQAAAQAETILAHAA